MSDDGDALEFLLVEQILLRSLMREVVARLAERSSVPNEKAVEICDSLYRFVDGYSVADCDGKVLEEAKERARMNVDSLRKSFEPDR